MKVVIRNQGAVEPEAFTLLGASSKRGDSSKIGQFGSGNKYALAYLIRHGFGVRIFSGDEEIRITTCTKHFRGGTFKILQVNGENTSITTDTGPGWDFWQAIRELYSNAMDEGNASINFQGSGEVHLYKDVTTIILEVPSDHLDRAQDMRDNFKRYFLPLDADYLYKSGKVAIYHGTDGTKYRKGIRCVPLEGEKQSIFSYDLDEVSINESRLADQPWEIRRAVWRAIITCDVPMIISMFLARVGDADIYEHNDDIVGVFDEDPKLSAEWIKALEGYKVCPTNLGGYLEPGEMVRTKMVPTRFYRLIVDQMGDAVDALRGRQTRGVRHTPATLTTPQADMLADVVNWFRAAGVNIDYPIEAVHFDNSSVYGLASTTNQTILISTKAFTKGSQFLAKVIFEEQTHLEHGVDDKTREMQNHYLDTIFYWMMKATDEKL